MIRAGGQQLLLFLDTAKVILTTLGEKYEEEHVCLQLSGYLIEPFAVSPMASHGQYRFPAHILGLIRGSAGRLVLCGLFVGVFKEQ